jgi:hypothetical protein
VSRRATHAGKFPLHTPGRRSAGTMFGGSDPTDHSMPESGLRRYAMNPDDYHESSYSVRVSIERTRLAAAVTTGGRFAVIRAAADVSKLRIESGSVALGSRELVADHVLDLLALVRGQHRGEGIELLLAEFATLIALGTILRGEIRMCLLDLLFLLGS